MRYIKGLRVDFDRGEAEFVMPQELEDHPTITKLDVLGDWKHDICQMYERVLDADDALEAGLTYDEYIERRKQKGAQVVEASTARLATFVGQTISAVDTDAKGNILVTFANGSKHALYHGGSSPVNPVLVSEALAA